MARTKNSTTASASDTSPTKTAPSSAKLSVLYKPRSGELAKRPDPATPSRVEERIHEWRVTRYKWEALIDSDAMIVRSMPPTSSSRRRLTGYSYFIDVHLGHFRTRPRVPRRCKPCPYNGHVFRLRKVGGVLGAGPVARLVATVLIPRMEVM